MDFCILSSKGKSFCETGKALLRDQWSNHCPWSPFLYCEVIFLSNSAGTPSAAVHQSLSLPTSFSLFWRGWTRGNGPEIKIKIQILLILYSKPIGLKIPPFSIGRICKIITPREIIITPREKFSLLGTYTPLRYAPALVRKIFHSG